MIVVIAAKEPLPAALTNPARFVVINVLVELNALALPLKNNALRSNILVKLPSEDPLLILKPKPGTMDLKQ